MNLADEGAEARLTGTPTMQIVAIREHRFIREAVHRHHHLVRIITRGQSLRVTDMRVLHHLLDPLMAIRTTQKIGLLALRQCLRMRLQ